VVRFQISFEHVYGDLARNAAVDLKQIQCTPGAVSFHTATKRCRHVPDHDDGDEPPLDGYMVMFPVRDTGKTLEFQTSANTMGAGVDCLVTRMSSTVGDLRHAAMCAIKDNLSHSKLWLMAVVSVGEPVVFMARDTWYISSGSFFPSNQCIRILVDDMMRKTMAFNAMITLHNGSGRVSPVSTGTITALVYPEHFDHTKGADTGVRRILSHTPVHYGVLWASMFKTDVLRHTNMVLVHE
jgi:hypothetical protein